MSYISNYDYVYGAGHTPNRQVIFTRVCDDKMDKICAEVFPLVNGKADKDHSLGKFTEDEIGVEGVGTNSVLKLPERSYSIRNAIPLSSIFPTAKEAMLKNLHRTRGRIISIQYSPPFPGENYEKILNMTIYDPRQL